MLEMELLSSPTDQVGEPIRVIAVLPLPIQTLPGETLCPKEDFLTLLNTITDICKHGVPGTYYRLRSKGFMVNDGRVLILNTGQIDRIVRDTGMRHAP